MKRQTSLTFFFQKIETQFIPIVTLTVSTNWHYIIYSTSDSCTSTRIRMKKNRYLETLQTKTELE